MKTDLAAAARVVPSARRHRESKSTVTACRAILRIEFITK